MGLQLGVRQFFICPMQDLIAKAATLLEALPYIQRFRSQTFVVKYGGSFMDSPDPAVRNGVAPVQKKEGSAVPGVALAR